jgi:hypothetical protein
MTSGISRQLARSPKRWLIPEPEGPMGNETHKAQIYYFTGWHKESAKDVENRLPWVQSPYQMKGDWHDLRSSDKTSG